MQHLSVETIAQIHNHLAEYFERSDDPIFPVGIRSQALLESAVYKQNAGFGDFDRYESPTRNAAALVYGLCLNHPFHNGNKRTALMSGVLHLDRNGLSLTTRVNRNHLFNLMLRIADHTIAQQNKPRPKKGRVWRPDQEQEIAAIDAWLLDRTRKIVRGEQSITFKELYRILNSFDHIKTGGHKKGNLMDVLVKKKGLFGGEKWSVIYKVPCPGDAKVVSVYAIKDVRRALELDEPNGVDSHNFYDTQSVIDGFIREHRQVLRRLART